MSENTFKTKEEISKNRWEDRANIDEVIDFIKSASVKGDSSWSWIKSWDCKYVSINFDMRDGFFTIRNKDGIRITFEELRYQRELEGRTNDE